MECLRCQQHNNERIHMNISDLSGTAGAAWGGNEMHAMSGASSYVPSANTSSSTDIFAQMRNAIKQSTQDFKSLKSALNSNDLAGATQAFASVKQDIQNISTNTGGKNPFAANSPIGKDFQVLGAALQSGDLRAAQQAFAQFRQDIKSAGHAARVGRHGGAGNDHDGDDGGSASGTSSTTNASGTGSGGLNLVA